MAMKLISQMAMSKILELQGSEWKSWLHIASSMALSKHFSSFPLSLSFLISKRR